MARIRTIKPEFWDSPDTARASLRARLLYIAMWNLADDYGVGDGNHRRIIGFAFPNDEIGVSEIPRLVSEVSRTFSVMFYEHEGRPYYYIPSWENHQRTEKRAKQRVPFPDPDTPPEKPLEQAEAEPSTTSVGTSAESLGNPGAGTGEQGNRGTGEIEKNSPPTPDEFIDWYLEYPRKESKGAAEKAYTKARTKTTAEELIAGAIRYAQDPNREAQFTKLPATWLNAGCWEDGPLPPRTQPNQGARPTASQARLQAGFDLVQRTQARQQGKQQDQLAIED
jgi:hypothetical protein